MKKKVKNINMFFIVIIIIVYMLIILSFLFPFLKLSQYKNYMFFLCICLSFLISLRLTSSNWIDYKDALLLKLGLLFTVLADYFLIFTQDIIIGICFFCLTQSLYIIRYLSQINTKIKFKYFKTPFIIFLFSFLIYSIYNKQFNFVYLISIVYIHLLMLSVYLALKLIKNSKYPYKNRLLIALGMLLFLLCDINVGLTYIFSNCVDISYSFLSYITFPLIWIFYIPSQLILSISGYRDKLLRKFI